MNPADLQISAKLLEAQRYVLQFSLDGFLVPAGISTFPIDTVPISSGFLRAKVNQVWRARILAGSFFTNVPNTLSLESAGLRVVPNAGVGPIAALIVPASFGAITALAQNAPIKTEWVELRAQDWNALPEFGGPPASSGWQLQVIWTVNNSGAGGTGNVNAVVEVERYLFDGYDLPVPVFSR